MNYLKYATEPATQREPLPGQVQNSAEGFSFAVDDWKRLERFLILGSEGGSYYASERKLTRDNAEVVARCIAADGQRAVATISDISHRGRAPKNDPAILALAMAVKLGSEATRVDAYAALPVVCRTGTHLYHFVEFATSLGVGWGRGMKRAVGDWWNKRPADAAAYQLVKYQSRDGWSARDLLRLAHPEPSSPAHDALYAWVTHPDKLPASAQLPAIVQAVEELEDLQRHNSDNSPHIARPAAKLIHDHKLPRECVPSQLLARPEIWAALLPHMGLTAMIRNLATMTRVGLLAPLSDATQFVAGAVTDAAALVKARVHPIAVLSALETYKAGHGERSDKTWSPVPAIVDALDAAFYASFGSVPAVSGNLLLAIDISGSMSWSQIAGVSGLTPRVASAAMALVTANAQPPGRYHVVAFSGGMPGIEDLSISPKMRLGDVLSTVDLLTAGPTDCALPMTWARHNKVAVDGFAVYTDSETYFGSVHPSAALRMYRSRSDRAARLAVVGMLANEFTIADPNDAGMLDLVGFDASAPALMADFFA